DAPPEIDVPYGVEPKRVRWLLPVPSPPPKCQTEGHEHDNHRKVTVEDNGSSTEREARPPRRAVVPGGTCRRSRRSARYGAPAPPARPRPRRPPPERGG